MTHELTSVVECDDEMVCVIISARAEGADMPTGKTKSRCAWEAVNLPAVRCLHVMCFGYATGNKNLVGVGAKE